MEKKLILGILGGFVAGALAATLIQPEIRKELLNKIDGLSEGFCNQLADHLESFKDHLAESTENKSSINDL